MNENAEPINIHEELLEQLQPRLLGYILSLTANITDAKDVLQESNRVILNKIGEFKQPNKFDAWAYKIAYYQCLSFLQKRKRSPIAFDSDLLAKLANDAADIDTLMERHSTELERCLAQLQDRTRSILSDYYYENHPIKRIAKDRGLKPNHVAQILHRARQALFQCMTRKEIDTYE